MGLRTSVSIDIGDVEKGLDAMERRAHALAPAYARIKGLMKEDQRDHAKTQSGPEGKWPARSAATRQHHRRLPRRILGKLPTAVAYRATATGAIGESRVKWGAAHQDGARVGRGSRLPARPFLWISDDLASKSADVIGKVVTEAFGGR
jgi:phage gpG-like protein